MLTRQELEELLRLQATAYDLLMWLADAANRDPELLSPDAVRRLSDPDLAPEWLEAQRGKVPEPLLPADPRGWFANLLSSFFATSFHVRHLEFGGRLVESRVTLGAERPNSKTGLGQCQALALRHLAMAEKIRITEREAGQLVRRKSLSEACRLWTYAWELDRRAREKGKGSVVHQLWRALPKDTRKSLTVEHIWTAREQLLTAARECCEARAVDDLTHVVATERG